MLQKVNIPASKAKNYPGKWVAISKEDKIVAVGDSLEDISEYVTGTKKNPPQYASFKVPDNEVEWMFPLTGLKTSK